MPVLIKIPTAAFPFFWVNLDHYPSSQGERYEVYLTEHQKDNDAETISRLLKLFYALFSTTKDDLKIYNGLWWDYCLDTWHPVHDEYDYSLQGKTPETTQYLSLLVQSSIEKEYGGSCECSDWDAFLTTALQCVVRHTAPYSPIFFSPNNDFFFYFHHTGSIGFYFRTINHAVSHIISNASKRYHLKSYPRSGQ